MEFKFSVFADYFQFYLEDEAKSDKSDDDLDALWSQENVANMLGIGNGFIAIGTARNMMVPVVVDVRNIPPGKAEEKRLFEAADQVTEASLEVTSGRIVVIGCTEYYPDAPRIDVNSGWYQVRIFYNDLDTLSKDGLEGDDSYHIMIYPGSHIEPKVLKRRK